MMDPKGFTIHVTATEPVGPPAWSQDLAGTPARGVIGDFTKVGLVLSVDWGEDVATEDIGTFDDGDHAVPQQTIKSGQTVINFQYKEGAGDAGALLLQAHKVSGAPLYLLYSNLVTADLEKFCKVIVTNITKPAQRTAGAVVGAVTLAHRTEPTELAVP